MSSQFYKFAVSLNEKLQAESECYVKIHKSIRKYRKIYLSNIYLYILSEDKVKCKVAASKIKKIIISSNSSQFVLLSDSKSILLDQLSMRQKIKNQLKQINPNIQIAYVKQPLLDDYVQGIKIDQKDQILTLNLVRLRNQYEDFSSNIKQKHFYQQYSSIDLVQKNDFYILMTAQKKNQNKNQKKKFSLFKKQKKQLYTVKVYLKKYIAQNKVLLDQILRERKYLEEILSPYIPTLYKCMYSKSSIYCITEYYRGCKLQKYLQNQSLTKSQFKSLISQIIMAIGQLHQCNLVYNNVNIQNIFVTDEGYILLNQFSKCCEINTLLTPEWSTLLQEYQPPKSSQDSKISGSWDWWNLGLLIYYIRQGKKWDTISTFQWQKEPELCSLTVSLLQKNQSQRLGDRNDYHQILGHPYFKSVQKKQLSTKTCQPLKKFFTANPQKVSYYSDGQDWSVNDSYLQDYQFNRELQ